MMTGPQATSARWRRIVGIAIAVLVLPFLLGDKGCYTLQTPIGDPDHAWADPRITGVWITGGGRTAPREYASVMWIFDPFDAKTWLVTVVDFTDRADAATSAAEDRSEAASSATRPGDQATSAQAADMSRIVKTLADDRARPHTLVIYKAWTVSLGGRRFLVLEPRLGPLSEAGLTPAGWFVFAADMREGCLLLSLVDDIEGLSEAKTRSHAEGIIARHANDPKLTAATEVLYRVPKASYHDASSALHRAWRQ